MTLRQRGELGALGGTGLHARCADGLEIGYWIHCAHGRRGYATEAAAALTAAAFGLPAVQQVQIRCDPLNHVSAAVPARLGYRHVETVRADTLTPLGAPRDTMVWQLTRVHFERDRELRCLVPTAGPW